MFGTSRPLWPVLVISILRTTSMPSVTRPKTTCLLSRKGVGTVVMKNWLPFVFGPAFCVWLGSFGGDDDEDGDHGRLGGVVNSVSAGEVE